MQIDDKEIREELSKILESYEQPVGLGYHVDKQVKIFSWIEIASEIGKLKRNE